MGLPFPLVPIDLCRLSSSLDSISSQDLELQKACFSISYLFVDWIAISFTFDQLRGIERLQRCLHNGKIRNLRNHRQRHLLLPRQAQILLQWPPTNRRLLPRGRHGLETQLGSQEG